MGIWFERNGIIGTTEVAPAGHVVYVVTAANGASMRTDVGSLARSVAIEWSVCPPVAPQMASPLPATQTAWVTPCQHGNYSCPLCDAPVAPQMASPLPAAERCASGLAGGFTAMSRPIRDMLDSARTSFDGLVWRGRLCDGNYPIGMLKSASRRGWLELDDRIRPSWGRLTDAGRRALARYDAKHGATAGAR